MKKMEDEPTPDFEKGLKAVVEEQQASAVAGMPSRVSKGMQNKARRLNDARLLYNEAVAKTLPTEEDTSTVAEPEELWFGIPVPPAESEEKWFGIPAPTAKPED